MTPTPAVAENLAQFVALDNQSKFCLKKASLVVPQLLMAFANTTEPCMTEFLPSTAFFNFSTNAGSPCDFVFKNSKYNFAGVSPLKIDTNEFVRACLSASFCS